MLLDIDGTARQSIHKKSLKKKRKGMLKPQTFIPQTFPNISSEDKRDKA